jgi:hypothetical protein
VEIRIVDEKFIKNNEVVSYYITECVGDDIKLLNKFVRGLSSISKITNQMLFSVHDMFEYNDVEYIVLQNEYGCFITRNDNVDITLNDSEKLETIYGIKSLIKVGDRTILIDNNNKKYTTKRCNNDVYDIEKAVMILLLKKEGYLVPDIYKLIESVKDNTKSSNEEIIKDIVVEEKPKKTRGRPKKNVNELASDKIWG